MDITPFSEAEVKSMNKKTSDSEATDCAATQEQHHGDLRKGAYLRRRADYQMQANAGHIQQAGTYLQTTQTTPSTKGQRR